MAEKLVDGDFIYGLQAFVVSKELVEITSSRAKFHEEKAKQYTDRVADLLNTKADAIRKRTNHQFATSPEEDLVESVYSNSKAEAETDKLERKAKEHLEKSKYFSFLSMHVNPNKTYVLDEAALTRLEVVPNGRVW